MTQERTVAVQETEVAVEAGSIGDLADVTEQTGLADVADAANDVPHVVEEKGESHLEVVTEVAEKDDAAELVEDKDVADLVEMTEVVKKEDVAALVETTEMTGAPEDDVSDLAGMTQAARKEEVTDLVETHKVVEEDDVAHLAAMPEVAEKEDVADLVEMPKIAGEDGADLAEMTEVAEEDGPDMVEIREVAETGGGTDLEEVTEETNLDGQVAENVDLSGPAAEEMNLAGPLVEETKLADVAEEDGPREAAKIVGGADLAEAMEETNLDGRVAENVDLSGPLVEGTDFMGPLVEETDLTGPVAEVADLAVLVDEEMAMADTVVDMDFGGHVDGVKEAVDKANATEVEDEIVEAGEDLSEKAMEAEDSEAVEVAERAEETSEAGEEMDVMEDIEMVEASGVSSGGRRKRGKNSRAVARVLARKKMEEDVCFICFDGGNLVLCDRRGCPKAYHPSCVNRDEAFFQTKGRWNCGWHLCSNCEKNAYYMCYTCTFSLCKACINDAVILCVRRNKGFCAACMKMVMLIEHNLQGNKDMGQVDFDDKSSWEYLFKDYWIDLKERLSLTLEELNQAKNPSKESDVFAARQESPDELYDANNDEGSDSDSSPGNTEKSSTKRRAKKRLKPRSKETDSPAHSRATGAEGPSTDENAEWGSKELLEFVMHMKKGDRSVLSQFDVQALLLEYIKRNKLRDPRRKSQIICDSRLQSLFGKPRVGHFEMLKLLESHFLIKEDSQADELQGSVVDTEGSQVENVGISDALVKTGRDKKRKTRKKGDERGPQSNLDDYAAIDIHNINLIYLRRNLVEELIEDMEMLHDKVVGSFVRIRISGSGQKQDLYRLVQVVGTCKAAEPYKVGKKMTDILLEILNLNKTEIVSIDIISNQEFTEDECKRLRQSIKCGLINRLTVGDIQDKAMALQEVRVKDWLETEIVRLSHLRDRASEKGRRKELRECVEKLQLLKTPEERQRRLDEFPEIHADPNMDPSYESEEDEGERYDKRQETYMRPRGTGFGRRVREPVSPQTGPTFSDSWGGTRNYSDMSRELSRNMSSKGFSYKGDDTTGAGDIVNERNQGRDRETQQASSWEKQRGAETSGIGAFAVQSVAKSETNPAVSEISAVSHSTLVAQSAATINEAEKMWHYQDPSGKVQGPFSIVQLRKWNNTGYFPANLKIWRASENQNDSLLLTDALAGKFQKDLLLGDNSFPKAQTVQNLHISSSYSGIPHGAPLQQGMEGQVGERSNFDENHGALNSHTNFDENRGALNSHTNAGSSGQSIGGSWRTQNEISPAGKHSMSVQVPNISSDGWVPNSQKDSSNLPSPTPLQTTTEMTKGHPFESKRLQNSVQTVGSIREANSFSGGFGMQSPAALILERAVQGAENTDASSNPAVVPVPKPDNSMLLGSLNALLMHAQSTVPQSILADASMSPSVNMKNTGTNFQNLNQSVANPTPIESQGWGSSLVPKPDMTSSSPFPGSESQAWGSAPSQKVEPINPATTPVQPLAQGNWGDAPSVHNSASSFSTGNPMGTYPTAGYSGLPPANPWRHPVPGNQSNIQPPAPATLTWGVGVGENQTSGTRPGPENQNTGWGPVPGNHNMGWGGPVPANANLNWGASGQGPAPGNGTAGWVAPGTAVPGWVSASQGLPMGNPNPGWVAPGQGPAPPGNANPGWAAPTGNPGNNGDMIPNQNVRGSHGRDSGYGSGKSWNRQSSFGGGGGGGGSRPPFKGQRVCKFHESGHCKKGASCDYLHT
ncbi:hypothetical protein I3760_14G037600 [Carya illinoinensis]|nr:hypothetical protein I3760_14G037600 [Carya illinoinensis]KAG2669494.1 hypothetical protein I3760_14G037600 [Carya illinoinensis]KAG2669502.1 hypothetical protein I3760_14G037600 [Carya illinoinensis]